MHTLVPFDHYSAMAGGGMGDITAFRARGGGWWSKVINSSAAKNLGAFAKDVGRQALSAGVAQLASGGDLRSSALAALAGGKSGALNNVQEMLAASGAPPEGSGYQRSKKRRRRHPF